MITVQLPLLDLLRYETISSTLKQWIRSVIFLVRHVQISIPVRNLSKICEDFISRQRSADMACQAASKEVLTPQFGKKQIL